MCFSSVPPGVGFVNKGLRGAPILEIACTFDLFTEQTFSLETVEALHTCSLGLMYVQANVWFWQAYTCIRRRGGCLRDLDRNSWLDIAPSWLLLGYLRGRGPLKTSNLEMSSWVQIKYPLCLLDEASFLSAVSPNMCLHTVGLKVDNVKGLVNLWVGETWVCEWPLDDG